MDQIPPTTLRPAAGTDIAQLTDLETESFDGDRLSRRSYRRLAASPSARVIVADGGHAGVLGSCVVLYRRGSHVARLYSLAVRRSARGHGLAGRLANAAEADAAARGCHTMRLEVRRDNEAALKLYQGLGYRLRDEIAGYYEDNCAAMRLQRSIGPTAEEA